MMLQSELVREELLARNDEFRRLVEEHSELDAEVGALLARPHPTPEDEAGIARLKKLKLLRKDQMEEMIRAYRREQSEAVQAT